MINITLLWLLALPIILAIIVWICRRKHVECYVPIGVFLLVSMTVVLSGFYVSKGSKTMDTEIWNGQVVSKDRIHDTYEEAYQCRCRTVTSKNSDGSTSSRQECDTCYRTHYTVEWKCDTTVGSYRIDKLDKTTRRVYNTPDPARYVEIQKGDPAARQASYTNYVQAVPNSLFTSAAADTKAKFVGLIPDYPDKVYDLYKVNHFLSPGYLLPEARVWNEKLAMELRERGPKKQVNAIVVVAKTSDSNYEYALRDAWEGANKNDVVLIIGSTQYPKIDFVRVLSWTKNELFKIELRDAVMEKGVIDLSIVDMMMAQIDKNFQRREMVEFEYLDGEIDPPVWLITLLVVLVTVGAVVVYIFIPQWCTPGSGRTRRFR